MIFQVIQKAIQSSKIFKGLLDFKNVVSASHLLDIPIYIVHGSNMEKNPILDTDKSVLFNKIIPSILKVMNGDAKKC